MAADPYNSVLFPTDGSETAATAFAYALDVAAAHDATVHVLSVVDTGRDSVAQDDDVVDALEDEADEAVAELADRAVDRGVPVVTDVLRGDPSTAIVDHAETVNADLTVMATHGRRDLERVLLGSVTERVVNAATVPVLVVNPEEVMADYPPKRVLVPTDGSRGAELALSAGIALAGATDAALHVLTVVERASLGPEDSSEETDAGDDDAAKRNETVGAAVERARESSLDDVTGAVAHGQSYREILSYVRNREIDAVVLGTKGQTDFGRYLLGGVTAKLLRTAPVPVMTVGAPAEEDSDPA